MCDTNLGKSWLILFEPNLLAKFMLLFQVTLAQLTFSRIMHKLNIAGLLEMNGKKIILIDVDGLRNFELIL